MRCPVCRFRSPRSICDNCGRDMEQAVLHTLPSVVVHSTSGAHHHFTVCCACLDRDFDDQLQRFFNRHLRR